MAETVPQLQKPSPRAWLLPLLGIALAVGACSLYDGALLEQQPKVLEDGGLGDAAASAGGSSTGGDDSPTGGATSGTDSAMPYDGGLDGSMPGDGGPDGALEMDATVPSGCGLSEFTDSDADGLEDCEESCPQDPDKTEPGVCGCGYPETDNGSDLGCPGLKPLLSHRYRFDGSGAVAVDSVGDKNGQLVNTSLSGDGALHLAGGTSDQHVVLPAGILSSLSNATIEVWLNWHGGNPRQRVFDFGLGRPADPSFACAHDGVQRFGSQFYYFCTAPLTWPQALTACYNGGVGATLAQVDDAMENAFLVSAGGGSLPMWLGGNDRGTTEGAWYWAERGTANGSTQFFSGGVSGSAVAGRYVNWGGNQPDNSGNEDCLELLGDSWNDADCGFTKNFICESPPLSSSPYTSFYVTTRRDAGPITAGVLHRFSESLLDTATAFPENQLTHLAVVYDDDLNLVTVYLDGQPVVSKASAVSLKDMEDFQNYIGRSLYSPDDELSADVEEFRIYDAVLSQDLLNLSLRAGPDPAYLE